MRAPGAYQLQAAIAALHDQAATPDATDWPHEAARGAYERALALTANAAARRFLRRRLVEVGALAESAPLSYRCGNLTNGTAADGPLLTEAGMSPRWETHP